MDGSDSFFVQYFAEVDPDGEGSVNITYMLTVSWSATVVDKMLNLSLSLPDSC